MWALPEVVRARLVGQDRVERLAVVGQVEAGGEDRHHPALVRVHDEFLVADGQPALQPAGGVEDEVDAGQDGRLERGGGLVGGLGIGDLRGAQRAAGAERDAEPAGQRGHHVQHERRLRRAERRRAGLHGHRARERPEHDRRARPDELHERHAAERLGQGLGTDAGRGDRGHRAGQDERGQQGRLVRLGIGARGAQHHRVPDERRVGVDQAEADRVVLEIVRTEGDAGQLDGVAGALWRRDRAHERLVAVADVRIDHVEVALVDRHVHRLAHRPARVVEMRRHVGELHEVPEVLDRAVAAAAVQVAHERRAVVRGEDRVHPADLDVPFRVARVLGELAWRGRLDDRAAHPAREPDPLPVDGRAGLAQDPEGVGIAAELEADLLEDRVGVVLDERRGPPRRGPRTGRACG